MIDEESARFVLFSLVVAIILLIPILICVYIFAT